MTEQEKEAAIGLGTLEVGWLLGVIRRVISIYPRRG